jgi:hypothetical protein
MVEGTCMSKTARCYTNKGTSTLVVDIINKEWESGCIWGNRPNPDAV